MGMELTQNQILTLKSWATQIQSSQDEAKKNFALGYLLGFIQNL